MSAVDQAHLGITHEAEEPKEIAIDDAALEGLDPEEQIKRLMGFGGFGSTKGKAVEDNQTGASKGAAAKGKARVYRQYMNRRGGFNRALDKIK